MVDAYEIMSDETYQQLTSELAKSQGSARHSADNGRYKEAFETLMEAVDEGLQTVNHGTDIAFHVEGQQFNVPNWEETTE